MTTTPKSDRFESLDVLRGVAILGIFAVNIIAFGYPFYALTNPSIFPDAYTDTGAFWWALSQGVFQFKFVTLFSAMFGAGIVLMIGEEPDSGKILIHQRRMFWLLIIGIIHCYVLWYGDILAPYAIAGFLVAGARIWPTRQLLIVATALITLNFGLYYLQDISLRYMSSEELTEVISAMWAPSPDKLQTEIELYRSGLFERLPHAAFNAFMAHLMQGGFLMMRTIGVMMIGMALYKSGFLTLRWSPMHYLLVGAVASALGAMGSFWSAQHAIQVDFNILTVFPGQAALYWASLIQAFGYASVVMFLCTLPMLKLFRTPFAAAGRMALSNYLASTLIGVLIFYGPPGLGKFATFSFADLAKVVGSVWLFILVWSPVWLSVFRFGPGEWAWRSLSYRRLQPILKTAS